MYDLTDVSAAACEDVDDGEVKGPPISVEDRVETAVRKCMEFLKTVDNQLSPCFPSRTGWDILHTAFSAVNIRVREIIFWAAQDDLKQWTFKDYVNLVKLIFELMASAGELGVSSDTLQDLEADLQVRAAPAEETFWIRSECLFPVSFHSCAAEYVVMIPLFLRRHGNELRSACRLSTLVLET